MPKIHISQSNRISFDIPIVDLTGDKDKKIFHLYQICHKIKKKLEKLNFCIYKIYK